VSKNEVQQHYMRRSTYVGRPKNKNKPHK